MSPADGKQESELVAVGGDDVVAVVGEESEGGVDHVEEARDGG